MARCEDCLHFDLCEAFERHNGLTKVEPTLCGFYKPAADVAPTDEVDCVLCPFCDYDAHKKCTEELARAIIDLINRQKAMIKRLGKGRKDILFETGDYAKIANNKSGHEFEIGTIVKLEKDDEDYKAFANGDYWWVTDDDLAEIDNDTLVKEMTEGNK